SLKLENKAESTIRKYRSILQLFFNGCSLPLETITSEDVLGWLNSYSKDKSPRTMDLVLSTLSSFFLFCHDEEYIDSPVIKKRWRPKIPHALPQYLTEQELARVKLAAETLPIRDRALILFLFSTGCRSSEVIPLKIKDIDMK